MRAAGYRTDKRYLVFQCLIHTLHTDKAKLVDYLLLLGLDVGALGWDPEFLQLSDISDDGNKLVGSGVYNDEFDAFIIDLAASEVPVPAALWLFASALLGLVSFRRRK